MTVIKHCAQAGYTYLTTSGREVWKFYFAMSSQKVQLSAPIYTTVDYNFATISNKTQLSVTLGWGTAAGNPR